MYICTVLLIKQLNNINKCPSGIDTSERRTPVTMWTLAKSRIFFIHEPWSRKPEIYISTHYEQIMISPHFPCFQKQVVSFQRERGTAKVTQLCCRVLFRGHSRGYGFDSLVMVISICSIICNYENTLFPEPVVYINIFTFWRPTPAQNNEYIQFPQSYLFKAVNILGCNLFTNCDKLAK